VYPPTVSTIKEIKRASQHLSPKERWELYRWLGDLEDVQRFRLEELRQEIAVGLEQAGRGEVAPLDVQAIKAEVHRRLATERTH